MRLDLDQGKIDRDPLAHLIARGGSSEALAKALTPINVFTSDPGQGIQALSDDLLKYARSKNININRPIQEILQALEGKEHDDFWTKWITNATRATKRNPSPWDPSFLKGNRIDVKSEGNVLAGVILRHLEVLRKVSTGTPDKDATVATTKQVIREFLSRAKAVSELQKSGEKIVLGAWNIPFDLAAVHQAALATGDQALVSEVKTVGTKYGLDLQGQIRPNKPVAAIEELSSSAKRVLYDLMSVGYKGETLKAAHTADVQKYVEGRLKTPLGKVAPADLTKTAASEFKEIHTGFKTFLEHDRLKDMSFDEYIDWVNGNKVAGRNLPKDIASLEAFVYTNRALTEGRIFSKPEVDKIKGWKLGTVADALNIQKNLGGKLGIGISLHDAKVDTELSTVVRDIFDRYHEFYKQVSQVIERSTSSGQTAKATHAQKVNIALHLWETNTLSKIEEGMTVTKFLSNLNSEVDKESKRTFLDRLQARSFNFSDKTAGQQAVTQAVASTQASSPIAKASASIDPIPNISVEDLYADEEEVSAKKELKKLWRQFISWGKAKIVNTKNTYIQSLKDAKAEHWEPLKKTYVEAFDQLKNEFIPKLFKTKTGKAATIIGGLLVGAGIIDSLLPSPKPIGARGNYTPALIGLPPGMSGISSGEIIHRQVQNFLASTHGYPYEVPVAGAGPHGGTGLIDVVAGGRPLEIKSEYLEGLTGDMDPEHIEQLRRYLQHTRTDHGWLMYVNPYNPYRMTSTQIDLDGAKPYFAGGLVGMNSPLAHINRQGIPPNFGDYDFGSGWAEFVPRAIGDLFSQGMSRFLQRLRPSIEKTVIGSTRTSGGVDIVQADRVVQPNMKLHAPRPRLVLPEQDFSKYSSGIMLTDTGSSINKVTYTGYKGGVQKFSVIPKHKKVSRTLPPDAGHRATSQPRILLPDIPASQNYVSEGLNNPYVRLTLAQKRPLEIPFIEKAIPSVRDAFLYKSISELAKTTRGLDPGIRIYNAVPRSNNFPSSTEIPLYDARPVFPGSSKSSFIAIDALNPEALKQIFLSIHNKNSGHDHGHADLLFNKVAENLKGINNQASFTDAIMRGSYKDIPAEVKATLLKSGIDELTYLTALKNYTANVLGRISDTNIVELANEMVGQIPPKDIKSTKYGPENPKLIKLKQRLVRSFVFRQAARIDESALKEKPVKPADRAPVNILNAAGHAGGVPINEVRLARMRAEIERLGYSKSGSLAVIQSLLQGTKLSPGQEGFVQSALGLLSEEAGKPVKAGKLSMEDRAVASRLLSDPDLDSSIRTGGSKLLSRPGVSGKVIGWIHGLFLEEMMTWTHGEVWNNRAAIHKGMQVAGVRHSLSLEMRHSANPLFKAIFGWGKSLEQYKGLGHYAGRGIQVLTSGHGGFGGAVLGALIFGSQYGIEGAALGAVAGAIVPTPLMVAATLSIHAVGAGLHNYRTALFGVPVELAKASAEFYVANVAIRAVVKGARFLANAAKFTKFGPLGHFAAMMAIFPLVGKVIHGVTDTILEFFTLKKKQVIDHQDNPMPMSTQMQMALGLGQFPAMPYQVAGVSPQLITHGMPVPSYETADDFGSGYVPPPAVEQHPNVNSQRDYSAGAELRATKTNGLIVQMDRESTARRRASRFSAPAQSQFANSSSTVRMTA